MRGRVDFLPTCQLRLQLLGQNRGGGEAFDQLLATLGATIGATVINQKSCCDAPVTSNEC
jgi:hypothetical protein